MSSGLSKPALAMASSSSAPVLSRQADRPRPHTAQVDSSLRRGAIASAAPKQPRKGYLAVGLNAAALSKKPQQRVSITESRTDRINRQLATADDVCKAAFDLFDSNGQGCISEAEMVRMMTRPSPSGTKMTTVQAKALFRNMDINANGGAEDGGGGVEFREFAIRWKRDAKMLSAAAHASLAADFELATPMLVMPFARFKEQGRIWKSTSTWRADAFRNGWLLPHEPGANGFVTVYVSHRWWHSPPGRPAGVIDWGGPDHAEGANTNLKWKMLCAAVEALIARDKLDQNRVALWIDWQSIYQDDAEAKALGIASLLKIATLCRYMLVPVDLPEIAAEARSDPLALPDYGGRAWCRLETFVFSLWAEMQPDQAPVQLYAVTSDGVLHQYAAPPLTCDDSAMPSHGELTLAEDRPLVVGLEERMAESYGHEMVWRACTGKEVDLRRRLLKAEHVAELHKALTAMGNSEMCELSLSYNRLHNDGLTHLAHLAAAGGGGGGVLAKLQRLFVDGNNVGDAGVVALASAASKGALPNLQQLSLKFNEVGPVGITALAEAINQGALPELQTIHLDQNRLAGAAPDTPDTDDGAVQQALAGRKRGRKPSTVRGPSRRGMYRQNSAPAQRSSLPLVKGAAMSRDALLAAARIEAEREARARFRNSKRLANQAWAAGDLDQCQQHLDNSIAVSSECDVLHRYRSRVHARADRPASALADAGRAVALEPRCGLNFHCQGRALHQSHLLSEAGAAHLSAMKYGVAGSAKKLGYESLLDSVRRERHYHSKMRPGWQKALGSGVYRPGSASIFDPRKVFTVDGLGTGGPPEPPSLRLVRCEGGAVAVEWDRPANNDEEDEHRYSLQMAEYVVRWLPQKSDFFDGFEAYATVYEGRVHNAEVGGLKAGNKYQLRLRAYNDRGPSEWSEVLEVTVPYTSKFRPAEHALPRSWLVADYSDLIAQAETAADDPASVEEPAANFNPNPNPSPSPSPSPSPIPNPHSHPHPNPHPNPSQDPAATFYASLAAALRPHVVLVRKVFKAYCSLSVGKSAGLANDKHMNSMQWMRFCRDVGMIDGSGGLLATPPEQARPLGRTDLELIFQRANIDAPDRPASRSPAPMRPSTSQRPGRPASRSPSPMRPSTSQRPSSPLEGEQLEGVEEDDDDGDDGGTAALVIREFVCALVRVAWQAYPHQRGVEAKMRLLIEGGLAPFWQAYQQQQEVGFDFEQVLRSHHVAAILRHYEPDLLKIFNSYAQADQSAPGSLGSLDTVSLPELIFAMKEGRMLDNALTVAKLSSIFARTNAASEDDADGDDNVQELCFEEFVQLIAAVCDTKVPADTREGVPFELTLQSWLHLIFLPTYKRILKDKARGVAAKTIK